MSDSYYDELLDLERLDRDSIDWLATPHDRCERGIVARLLCQQRCDRLSELLAAGALSSELTTKLLAALRATRRIFGGMPWQRDSIDRMSPRALAEKELLTWRPSARRHVATLFAVEVPVRRDWERRQVSADDPSAVLDFYRNTDSYIWELLAANNLIETLYNYAMTVDRLRSFGVTTLLDYGAGIGSFVLAATASGIRTTHMDLPSPSLDFARWRYDARSVAIPMREARGDHSDLPSTDAIVCTEVVEHLSEPLRLLDAISDALPIGGVAAVSESCAATERFVSHLPQNTWLAGDRFVQEMQRRRLYLIDIQPQTKILLFEKRSVRSGRPVLRTALADGV